MQAKKSSPEWLPKVESAADGATTAKPGRKGRTHGIFLGLLLCFYAAAIALIRPFGNLLYGGDDWAYAWSVERLLVDGELVASHWVAAAAVPQVLWGAAFCKVFGFSFLMLNVATMVLGVLGPILVYAIASELRLAPKHAALVGFFSVVNPLYLSFASSFMSDTYYLILMLASVLAYARGLQRRQLGFLLLGSAIASLALLQRQIGIVTPAAVVGSLVLAFLGKRRSFREAFIEALAAALVPAVSVAIFRWFPDAFGGTTHTQLVKLSSTAMWARLTDVGESLSNAYTTLVYVAVLLVPLALALLPAFARSLRSIRSRFTLAIAGVLVALSLTALVFGLRGKLHLWTHGEFLHPVALPLFGESVWSFLAFLGSIVLPLSAVIFVLGARNSLFGDRPLQATTTPPTHAHGDAVLAHVFLALTLVLHLILIATFIAFFNNYILPLVPLALLLLATSLSPHRNANEERWFWVWSGVVALFAFVWSTLNIDLMFRYVEADDRLTEKLVASGTPSSQIFGYPGAYARRHYAIAEAQTLRNPWGIFGRMRSRCRFVILPEGLSVPARFNRVVQTETYRTLVGDRTLELRARSGRRR